MGRPSNREKRRRELTGAFARVLAEHGYAGATIAAVADEAGVSPGLVHHHFKNKEELLDELVSTMLAAFRSRVAEFAEGEDPLLAYGDGALALGATADVTAARCWVGVFAEALSSPALYARVRRLLDAEVSVIARRSGGRLDDKQAGAALAFIVGSLVFGAFAPRKTAGFAAPGFRQIVSGAVAVSGGVGSRGD